MTAKLCMECYHKFFGDRRPSTLTWGAACTRCGVETPLRGLLVKAEIPDHEAVVISP